MAQLRPAVDPELQCEAAWAVSIISAGTSENTRAVVECGAIPLLVGMLATTCAGRQCGRSATSRASAELRDAVLQFNVLPQLLCVLKSSPPCIVVVRSSAWSLSILCCALQCHNALEFLHRPFAFCFTVNVPQMLIDVDAGVCRGLVNLLAHLRGRQDRGAAYHRILYLYLDLYSESL